MNDADTILTTDQHPGYGGVNKFMAHRTINHSVSYSERDLFTGQFGATHTNTIEGFWAIVKRAIYNRSLVPFPVPRVPCWRNPPWQWGACIYPLRVSQVPL